MNCGECGNEVIDQIVILGGFCNKCTIRMMTEARDELNSAKVPKRSKEDIEYLARINNLEE